ncbi:DUF4416 family protein [Candidatus Omnitrophota bacterium]
MGKINEPEKVMLFCGLLYTKEDPFLKAKELLENEYGSIEQQSDVVDFTFTDYYDAEMGEDIKRCFISFATLINAEKLPEIKIHTNAIEDELAIDERRQVNIDPGYVSNAKIVLASTKDYSHRLLMSQNIFAEITLNWTNKKFVDLPWTYPDYQSDFTKEYFLRVRDCYRKKLTD